MKPFDSQLTEGQQMLACVTFLADGEEGADLFKFAGAEAEEKLAHFAERWFRGGRLNRKEVAQHIRCLTNRQKELSFFHDVHPGWLVEYLRGESPRVIGLVCRWLPSDKVRYIIQNLPGEVRCQLPRISDAYSVPTDLAIELRKILETRFRPSFLPMKGEPFSFYHLAWLKEEELLKVVKEIGVMEISSAFSKVESSKLRALLNRFPYEQAKMLYKRIKSPSRRWRSNVKSQRHIVSLDIAGIRSEELFLEVGFSLLAHAITPDDLGWCETIIHHLPPQKGYLFKRYVQQAMTVCRRSDSEELKRLILGSMVRLADLGFIQKYWKDEEYTTDLPKEAA